MSHSCCSSTERHKTKAFNQPREHFGRRVAFFATPRVEFAPKRHSALPGLSKYLINSLISCSSLQTIEVSLLDLFCIIICLPPLPLWQTANNQVHACTLGLKLPAVLKQSKGYMRRWIGCFSDQSSCCCCVGPSEPSTLPNYSCDALIVRYLGLGNCWRKRVISKLTFMCDLILSSGTHQKSQPERELFCVVQKFKFEMHYCHILLAWSFVFDAYKKGLPLFPNHGK